MSETPEILITFPGGKRVNADFFGRIIETDQSPRAGGDGSAPEPFALFLASIGTCAGIYVLGFLQSRGLSTEGVQIRQGLQFNAKGVVNGIDLNIDLPETVPAKYHEAIRRSADMCTVKKVIQSQPTFRVNVNTAGDVVAA